MDRDTTDRDIRIGLAGAGYWGSKLARNLYDANGGTLAVIADNDELNRDGAVGRYPGTRGVASVDELVAADDLDAVVVATPAGLHAEHARAALEAGKHVMVEKPFALSSSECDALRVLAEDRGVTLMVGHTFVYSEPVRKLRQLIRDGELGRILYVYGQRLNLGIIREDLNALWNFGPHDVSILLHLLEETPVRVSAQQFHLLDRDHEDVAFVVLEFPSGSVGHIHESWLDPRKVRQFTVVGDEKMAVYDDTQLESPVQIYDKGIRPIDIVEGPPQTSVFDIEEDFGRFKLDVRSGDILVPRVEPREPLRTEVEHFIECAITGQRPMTDGIHGRQVVSILETAERSAADGGRWVAHGEPASTR
jgi:predicted dehydrogenase